MRFFSSALLRRLEAAVLAALTLWVVYVTAGSETVTSAAAALWEAVPIELLKWELGDARPSGTLSPTAAMVIRESPILRGAQPVMAEVQQMRSILLVS